MDIQDIQEKDRTFQVPFTLYLSWSDSRLQYKHLSQDTERNLLSGNEKSNIWKPIVVFKNTNKKQKTIVDEDTDIQIRKKGSYIYTSEWEAEEAKIFEGDKNIIIMQRYYREMFTCK